MSKVFVKDVRDKERLQSIFLVGRKTQTVSRGGKPYLALTLRDKTGELDARVWERVEEFDAAFAKGDLVEVEGEVISFQGRPQLKIERLEKTSGEGLDPADFAPPPRPVPENRNLAQIQEMIERLQDPHLKALLLPLLEDEALMADFKRAPAAKSVHHARTGGLLEHTLSVMKLAQRIADHYPMVDRELMVAGAFLHDICKTRELRFDHGVEYTDEGRLVGHLVMAAQLIHERSQRIEGFPPALAHHLTHIVLSHHGTLDFGSPRVPMTLEAMLVHYIDEMDSRVGSWLEAMQRDPNETWTDFQKLYGRHLFKGAPPTAHGRPPVERRRKKREPRPEPTPEPAAPAEAPAAAPSEQAAEAPSAERRREKRERPERPPRKERDKEEKLTFKPFAALSPTPPIEPEPEPEPEPESGPEGAPEPRSSPEDAPVPEQAVAGAAAEEAAPGEEPAAETAGGAEAGAQEGEQAPAPLEEPPEAQ